MKSIGYISTAIADLTEQQVREIVVESHDNNQSRDVTGILVFNGHNFIQFIEGPDAACDELMETIVCDDRHFGVVRIRDRAIDAREFPNWSMAGRVAQNHMIAAVREEVMDLPVTVAADTRQMLTSFASLTASR